MSSNKPLEKIIQNAANYATNKGHEYVCIEHLTLALLETPELETLCEELKIDIDRHEFEDVRHYWWIYGREVRSRTYCRINN